MTILTPLGGSQTTTPSWEISQEPAFSDVLAAAKDKAAGNIVPLISAGDDPLSGSSPRAGQLIPSNYYFDLVPPGPAFLGPGSILPGPVLPGPTFILPFRAKANGPDEPQDPPEPPSADNSAAQAAFYADQAAASAANTVVLADATGEIYDDARANAWPAEEVKVSAILADVTVAKRAEESALAAAEKADDAAIDAYLAAAEDNPEAAAASAAAAKAAAYSAADAAVEAASAYSQATATFATMIHRNPSLRDLPKWPE